MSKYAMTRDEFISEYEHDKAKNETIVKCSCGAPNCAGWRFILKEDIPDSYFDAAESGEATPAIPLSDDEAGYI